MMQLFRRQSTRLLLTLVSVFSFVILTFFFYLPYIHYAIIPYVWRGWFLPIEGIILLLAFAGIFIVTGCIQLFFQKNKAILRGFTDYWWIGVRIFLGFSWILAGLTIWKPLFSKYDFPQMVNFMVAYGPFPWYNALLAGLVSSNAQVFALLIQYTQLFIGFCLVLGLLTNLASIIGTFLNINFLLAISWADPTWTVTAQNIFMSFHLFFFILLLVGRDFGVDEFLAKKTPKITLW